MTVSVDIVIPSYRLDEQYLIPMLNLKLPQGFIINYYIVADNPSLQIPASIQQLSERNNVHLLINPVNLGFSKTRNKGIDAGRGQWILLLDDDVLPNVDLLCAYARQILLKPDALGFVGVTEFPPPINSVTKALQIIGVSTHFQLARREADMYWLATANIILNRSLLSNRRFLPELTKSTEDMELLFRNAFENHLKKYQAVPDAVVKHQWWDNGSVQTQRMFLYGEGASEVAKLHPVNLYTYYDFTNTIETLLLILIVSVCCIMFSVSVKWLFLLAFAQILAELLTNYYRTIKIGKSLSPVVAYQVTWHKNILEAGRLWGNITDGYLKGFALRTDGSFYKQHPQPFRLNRYKIIKLVIFTLVVLLLYLL